LVTDSDCFRWTNYKISGIARQNDIYNMPSNCSSSICYLWGTANVQWKNANWTWNDCQLVRDICETWGCTPFLWKNANWRWSECSGSIPPIPVVSIGNQPGIDATTLIQPWLEEPWNPYRTGSLDRQKRLVKLVCKVKGQRYEEEKEMKDFNVSVDDIRMVVKAVANIDLDLRLEE